MALEIFRLVGSVFVDTDDADKSLQKSDKNAEGLGKRFLSVVQTAGKFAAGVVGAATTAGAAIIALTENTREYRTEQGKLEAAFETSGFAAGDAKDTYIALNGVLGDSGQAVEAANHLAKLCDNSEELSSWTKICTGVYATFGASLPIEGLTEAANETAKVGQVTGPLADALNWAGVSEDAFNESLAACTSEQERQALITKTLTGLYSTAADKYREVNKEVIAANIANDKLASVMAEVGGAAEPIITQGKTLIADVLTKAIPYVELLASVWIPAFIAMITNCCIWIGENSEKIVEWTGYVVSASAGVAAFLLYMNWGQIMSAAASALKLVTSAIQKMNSTIKSNPIGLLISLITSLIAYLGYLYSTNEEFRAFVDEMLVVIWARVKEVIGWIQANVLPVIQEIIAWLQANALPAIQTMFEWIKANVIPVIQSLVTWIRDTLLPAIQTMFEWIKANVIPVIQSLVAWIRDTLLPAIQTMFEWIKANVLPVLKSIFAWINDNVIPIVQAVIGWLGEKIGGFFAWFVGIFQSTSDSTGGIWEKIKGFFSSAWDFIVGIWEACQPFFQSIWDGIILPVWGLIQEMIGAFQMAWDVIKLVWEYVEPFFSAIWEGIKLSVGVLWDRLSLGFKNAWEGIKLVWNMVGPYFKALWESIKTVFSVVATYLCGFFKTAWEAIKAVWNVVISYFTMVWAGIKAVFAVVKGVLSGNFSDAWEAIKNLWDKAKSYFADVWSGIKNVFGSAGSWFENTFKTAWNAVKNVFSAWGSFFGSLWTQIKDKFSAIGTNISNAISSSVKSGLNGVISAIEGIINSGVNMINGAINLINDIPGVNIGKLGKLSLPRLYQGAVLEKGQVGLLEGNGAEAVVPLHNNQKWISAVARDMDNALGGSSDNLENVEEFLVVIISKLEELLEALLANQNKSMSKRDFKRLVKEVG